MKTETQKKLIGEHLESGKPITTLDALSLFGCFRLSARIHELKQRGLPILSRTVKRNKKNVSEYYLEA